MIDSIKSLGWCDKFVEYFILKKEGLRKAAQKSMNDFINIYKKQDTSSRRQFIDIVNKLVFNSADYELLPYNLYHSTLLPDLEHWIKEEPTNPIPYKWSSNINLIRRALDLSPNDQEALIIYGNRLIGHVSMNQHELNHGLPYLGDASDDYIKLDNYQRLLPNIGDEEKRNVFMNQLVGLKQVAFDCMSKASLD
ncbi:hypothetical protein C8P68_101340 [Mucilaginibacter yixingensis]|uniref:Uncharacterized protein n=1 Tax=Mucilaginibacter yixingensis TaxID=1295612 RepID=A0A2T5JF91_9SPHI|nr:hypothetical protein [Mucilaginibacter yixingensis]PTR01108.1 hypothetical protein C8P68_101340 [Mucilaginibacter yixingensis]